ncbi:MAG: hypothetical protein JW734_06465, partial [Candidatus Omnitrophica bacterium]|nr:hypothetical protein [Candidatus Omnitrophota bacterium]
VDFQADDDIRILGSKVKAINETKGSARTTLSSAGNIYVDETSKVKAVSLGFKGNGLLSDMALVLMLAGGGIDLEGLAKAESQNGLAIVALLSGDYINATGKIRALSENSFAGAALLGIGDIYAGDVRASGGSLSGMLLGSLSGDITLGMLEADVVLAAALGLDGSGSIYDEGDVYADYLGLLARNDIGTKDTPINTYVDILSAYSWDKGSIYINEADDIELGLYLPFGSLTLGASVAANDGIIHITSLGDMIVNSVVSPNGGVFLETTEGSIYAGRGWCPHLSESDLDIFGEGSLRSLAEEFMMDLRGTGWGILGGYEFFSPVMVGVEDLPAGPNVIAGGYSYFSAPQGTIGVGRPEDFIGLGPEGTLGDINYNPLNVCIQVLDGSHDARPFIPEGAFPSDSAGLILNIGGATPFTINGANGYLPLSGFISGIVRAYDGAGVNILPSVIPALKNPFNPPGYVFFHNTDANCCASLYGPAANDAVYQIWPPIPQSVEFASIIASSLKGLKGYYETLGNSLFLNFEPVQGAPLGIYAYHPLNGVDFSAFDSINLDAGAYDFIENMIKLKKILSPFFSKLEEEDEDKKGES